MTLRALFAGASAALTLAGCTSPRSSGGIDVFVAVPAGAPAFDRVELSISGEHEHSISIDAADFVGTFRVESAPVGAFSAKVIARQNGDAELEAPTRTAAVVSGRTTGIWTRLNPEPDSDSDGDGRRSGEDNCPLNANAAQADGDGDAFGDPCDNCPSISNPDQSDVGTNGIGDACETPPDGLVRFPAIASIFTARCAFGGCHDAANHAENLTLAGEAAYAETVNVVSAQPLLSGGFLDRVEPGLPAASYLYLKVTGDPDISGERMPQSPANPLTADEIARIEEWIADGALP